MPQRRLFEGLEPRQLLAAFTVTNSEDSGPGSLRQAVLDANGAAGADTVSFSPSLNGQTITLTTGEMVVAGPLTITGPGANLLTISGNNASRVFRVNDGNTDLENIQFTGLRVRAAAAGSALDVSNANVTVSSCEFSDSVTGGAGGGIFLGDSTLTITDSLIYNNESINGGGIFVLNSSMTMRNCTVANNRSSQWGGGISRWTNLPSTHVTISNSTIAGNTSVLQGGGIYARIGEYTIVSTIIAGNTNSVSMTADDASTGGHGLNAQSVANSSNGRTTVSVRTPASVREALAWGFQDSSGRRLSPMATKPDSAVAPSKWPYWRRRAETRPRMRCISSARSWRALCSMAGMLRGDMTNSFFMLRRNTAWHNYNCKC